MCVNVTPDLQIVKHVNVSDMSIMPYQLDKLDDLY
jgi:hypothetical protein